MFAVFSGLDRFLRRFTTMEARLTSRLGAAGTEIGARLEERVHENLGGAVLHRRSGRLDAAQTVELRSRPGRVSVSVGFDTRDVPYGAIQEFGGTTRAHLIEAKRAKALAFTTGGALVFAKRVHHPGSTLPARPFLALALDDEAPDASDRVSAAVFDELDQ